MKVSFVFVLGMFILNEFKNKMKLNCFENIACCTYLRFSFLKIKIDFRVFLPDINICATVYAYFRVGYVI